MKDDDMIFTIDEIKAMDVDLQVAQHCLSQCEKRLECLRDTSDCLERKAITLFNLYAIIITAIIASASTGQLENFRVSLALIVIGIVMFAACLFPMSYGRMGVSVSDWLKSDRFPNKQYTLGQKLLVLCHHYQQRHKVSERSNELKLRFYYGGIFAGMIAICYAAIIVIA
jgi:hypothetical protein